MLLYHLNEKQKQQQFIDKKSSFFVFLINQINVHKVKNKLFRKKKNTSVKDGFLAKSQLNLS
jgi:hypothetical protein